MKKAFEFGKKLSNLNKAFKPQFCLVELNVMKQSDVRFGSNCFIECKFDPQLQNCAILISILHLKLMTMSQLN